MGQFTSAEEKEQFGFNVIAVQPQSPGQRAGLISYYDFIMTANGIPLRDMNKQELQEFVASLEGQAVRLKVYHRERAMLRNVLIYPSRDWPGTGLLGVSVKLNQYTDDSRVEKGPSGENRRCSVNLSYDEIFRTVDQAPNEMIQESPDDPASPIAKVKKPIGVRIVRKLQKMTSSSKGKDFDLKSHSLDSSDISGRNTNSTSQLNSSSKDSFDDSNPAAGIAVQQEPTAVSIRNSSTGSRVKQEASPMRVMRSVSADSSTASAAAAARGSRCSSNVNRPLPTVPELGRIQINDIEEQHQDAAVAPPPPVADKQAPFQSDSNRSQRAAGSDIDDCNITD